MGHFKNTKENVIIQPNTAHNPPTPASSVNYVPLEALKNSEEAKTSIQKKSKDPFNEDKVSKTEPSTRNIQISPPDDTVQPG